MSWVAAETGGRLGHRADPVDSLAIWVNTEYAVATNDWETRVAMSDGTAPGAYINANLSSMTFGVDRGHRLERQFAFTLTNNGIDTLDVVSIDIPDSNFILLNTPSYLLKIATFGKSKPFW